MGEFNAQTIPPIQSGHEGFVVMGDFHQTIIGDTTPLTNVPFDEYVSTAIRPPAGILVSGFVNRGALALADDYAAQGWNATFVGDYVDASHQSEWNFFKSQHDQKTIFPLSAPGNHDGEALGTILNTENPHGAASLLVTERNREETQMLDDRAWMDDYLGMRYARTVSFVEMSSEMTVDPNDAASLTAYWTEMPNGDFICAIHTPHDAFKEGASFLVQARKVSDDLGGRPVYQIVLDTSDMSERLPSNASVGMVSSLQKNLVLLFMNAMQAREKNPLFVLCGHMAPHEQGDRNWKKAGLDDLYSRRDVFPVAFYANGHHRDNTDETAKGRVSRVSPFYSVMTPALVDAPNEFMLIDLAWEEGTQTYVMTQEYRALFPEEDSYDETVRQAVHAFDNTLAHRHYATYSELSTRPLATAVNILFRKKVLKRDADLVQWESLEEDVPYIEKYLEFLRVDALADREFIQQVEVQLAQLKMATSDEHLIAPSQAALDSAQELQRLISETPFDAKAAQFMILLAKVASEGEGVPGVRHGLEFVRPDPVSGRNVFHWNPAQDTVTYTNQD